MVRLGKKLSAQGYTDFGMYSVLLLRKLERTLTYTGAKCEIEGKEPKRAFNVPEIEAFFPPSPSLRFCFYCMYVRLCAVRRRGL